MCVCVRERENWGLGWEPNIYSMTPDGLYPLLIIPQTQQECDTLSIIHMSTIRAVFFSGQLNYETSKNGLQVRIFNLL